MSHTYYSRLADKVICPEETVIAKAVSPYHEFLHFGTAYVISEKQREWLTKRYLRYPNDITPLWKLVFHNCPSLADFLAKDFRQKKWGFGNWWQSFRFEQIHRVLILPKKIHPLFREENHEFCTALFLRMGFETRHNMQLEIHNFPGQTYNTLNNVLYLLSGYLQTGETFNLRNFEHYEKERRLKFLPFAISSEEYQFNMYMPSWESVFDAIVAFENILDQMRDLEPILPSAIRKIQTILHLQKIQDESMMIQSAIEDVEKQLKKLLGPWKKRFSFVYGQKSLRGSQDAITFPGGLLGKHIGIKK